MSRIYRHPPSTRDGFPLCKCGCNRRVMPPRSTFMNAECYQRYRIKTEPVYMRQCVFDRDKGICAVCKLDTVELLQELLAMSSDIRILEAARRNIPLHRIHSAGSLHDIHHIKTVCDGGETIMQNLETRCLKCHAVTTAVQAACRAKPKVLSALQIAKHRAESVNFD